MFPVFRIGCTTHSPIPSENRDSFLTCPFLFLCVHSFHSLNALMPLASLSPPPPPETSACLTWITAANPNFLFCFLHCSFHHPLPTLCTLLLTPPSLQKRHPPLCQALWEPASNPQHYPLDFTIDAQVNTAWFAASQSTGFLFFCQKILFSLLKCILLHLETFSCFRINGIHFPLGKWSQPAPKAILGCPFSTLTEHFNYQIEMISFPNLIIKFSKPRDCKGLI